MGLFLADILQNLNLDLGVLQDSEVFQQAQKKILEARNFLSSFFSQAQGGILGYVCASLVIFAPQKRVFRKKEEVS